MTSPHSTRILHVDDEPAVADLVASYLELECSEFDVISETDPEDALDRVGTETFHCIVSDYNMPKMDGLALLDAVREENAELPFILFTGEGSEEVAVEAIARGVTDYLQKQGASEQYGLLANRISNAVAQYRAANEAENLDRIRRVLRDTNQALIRATSREDLEQSVCEIISAAEPYLFAWVGEHNIEKAIVEPRVAAGVEDGYLDEITITTDEEPTAQGPTGRAIRTHEIQVMQNIPQDPAYEPWRQEALHRGYQSSAAVPLAHNDTLYGILNVYADRTFAFDEQERELLQELSDDIAYALYTVEIQATQRRYERIIENLPVGVYCTTDDTDGRIVDANPALAHIFGAESVEELFEYPVRDFYRFPEDRTRLRHELDENGVIHDREYPMLTLSGEEIWVSITAIMRQQGADSFIEGFLQEITDRKRHERELARNKARYQTVCEQTPDMILIHDADGRITEVNQQTCEKLSYTRDELLGLDIWNIDATADPDRSRQFWEDLPTNETPLFDGIFRRKDGDTFPVEVHLRRMKGGDTEFLAIVRDVSSRKERERQLEEQASQLKRQNQRLGDFADILSHDIPNHLNIASGYLELVEQETETEHLARIDTALERIQALIDDMQTVVRTGEPVDETDWIQLSSIADPCWGSCCLEADPASLEITTDGYIRADKGRLKQLFENLFWNACDHAGTDVSVRAGLFENGFYVADDGPGIPTEERDDVLAPGYSTGDDHHSGLGLTIVREIVEAHGWDIQVIESNAGGVRFEVTNADIRKS